MIKLEAVVRMLVLTAVFLTCLQKKYTERLSLFSKMCMEK